MDARQIPSRGLRPAVQGVATGGKHDRRALKPWSEKLLSAYQRPDRLRKLDLPVADPKSRDIHVKALKRLARQNASLALEIWAGECGRYPFSGDQVLEVLDEIAARSLSQEAPGMASWRDAYLAARGDDKLLEQRLRKAIADSDWVALDQLVRYLPGEAYARPVWRFWEGYAARENGDEWRAQEIWTELAGERQFYGFLWRPCSAPGS